MPAFRPGLVHCPVTPFKGDQSVDYATYAKVLEFHLKNEAPRLARQLHDLCASQQYTQARKAQEHMATLHHTLKKTGFAGLKVALSAMGRECGSPRPPVDALGEVEAGALAERLHALSFLQAEPRGW